MSLAKILLLTLALACCGAAAGCAAAEGPQTTMDLEAPAVTSPTPSAAPPASTSSSTISTIVTTTTSAPPTSTTDADARAVVLEVVDGDTLLVRILGGSFPGAADGAIEEVRIIGIDAPETGEALSAAATAALKKLCAGAQIELSADQENRDQYGRLLAYLFLEDGTFVNGQMLRLGFATLFIVPPNERFADRLQLAQSDAQEAHIGVWAAARPSPVEIVTVRYDPPGDDTLDLNEEYVVFRVTVAGNLKGYAVKDESGKHFAFPSRTYQKGQTITLHSGHGADTVTDVYWGFSTSAVWNNGGDTVKVLDPEGHIVESSAY